MNKFEQIVANAQYAMCVVGNAERAEYELLEFPLPDERGLIERGMVFVGVVGLVEGIPRSALAIELDAVWIDRLSSEFAGRLTALLEARALAHLYSLPDPCYPN